MVFLSIWKHEGVLVSYNQLGTYIAKRITTSWMFLFHAIIQRGKGECLLSQNIRGLHNANCSEGM